jgi:hypothetical protein
LQDFGVYFGRMLILNQICVFDLLINIKVNAWTIFLRKDAGRILLTYVELMLFIRLVYIIFLLSAYSLVIVIVRSWLFF